MTPSLTSTTRLTATLQPRYNGVGDRVAQTVGVTTTYLALDVVGLPEVIQTSEGHSYLHLPGVIMAESSAGEVRYLLSDGLGSVRQATDENGAVVAYHEYDPYGNPILHSSFLISNYGFTGEWWQDEVGLLHLRARWYAPEDGVFLSRDAVEGEPPYLYVRGNPVNYTDPSGMCAEFGDDACWNVYDQIIQLCPECAAMTRPTLMGDRPLHQENIGYLQTVLERVRAGWRPSSYQPNRPGQDDRDLTPWLYTELKVGIMDPDVNFIKELNTETFGENSIAGTGIAGVYWRALVRNKARYDFKHKIREQLLETILFRANDGTELWSEFSVPGNIFFGYVGSYVGFPGWLTHGGAGYAQIVDQREKIRNICDIPRYIPPSTIWHLGDNPTDYRGVQFGIDLWKKYGADLNLVQFRNELEQNLYKFTPPPSLPGTGTIPPYGWRNPLGGWPYWLGRFNGPDEDKYWPPTPENGFGFGEF